MTSKEDIPIGSIVQKDVNSICPKCGITTRMYLNEQALMDGNIDQWQTVGYMLQSGDILIYHKKCLDTGVIST